MADRCDVAVLGAGPAGAAVAAACAQRDLDVVLVAPDPAPPWPATYAAWVDDLDGVDLPWPTGGPFAHVWPEIVVHGARRHVVARSYGLLANDALQKALLEPLEGRTHASVAVEVRHDSDGSTVRLADGSTVSARVVVDARGRPLAEDDTAQVGYGLSVDRDSVADRVRPDTLRDECVLMDWRRPGDGSADSAGVPTFLYVLQHGGRVLLEETSLAARPPVEECRLRDLLTARVGVDLTDDAVHVERVSIPVGVSLPASRSSSHDAGDADARSVAFGAAAGLVHPATGYSVATSLRLAPKLAGVLALAIAAGLPVSEVSHAGREVVWPRWQRRTRALQDYGLSTLLRLDAAQTAEFFDAFFDLTPHEWAPYMRVDAHPGEVAAVMRRVFANVSWPLRRTLATGDPRPLRRLLTP